MIYRTGSTTYKFLPPRDQHLVIRDGHEYLNIGTTQTKGTHTRQQIWLDLTAQVKTPTPEQQPPDRTYRCPFKQTDTASKQANISSGKVYQISSGSKIKLSKPNEKYIGTIQYGKTRRTIIRESQELTDPRPHTTHDMKHPRDGTPTSNSTHTGSLKGHPSTGHRNNIGHLIYTGSPNNEGHPDSRHPHTTFGINPVNKQLPNKQDDHKLEAMKQRPDAADAGNFLRRQIKSPGNFSRSNRKSFLIFEEEMDNKFIQDTIIAKRLRKKAPAKTSLATTLIRNTLLFHEDIQAGQCSRYQCQKPRICFLARKSKQTSGSLYDSWKCYQPPPRWGNQ